MSAHKSIAIEAAIIAGRYNSNPVASVGAAREIVWEAGQI